MIALDLARIDEAYKFWYTRADSEKEIDVGGVMKKKHLGSNFEDFLETEGILEECRASAIKFKLAHELEKAMSQQNISKAEMAKRLKTSRTGIDRLLDPDNTSITLNTMAKVAHLLGKRIDFALR
ncbi:MAG: helix-turn-helix domain-containing protein [Tepidisphaeraceae bacterium]